MGQLKLPEGYIDASGRPMGLFLNMPEAEYHAVKDAFSYSLSKEFAKSPAHAKAYQNKEWEVDADREKFKAVHLLCLEPELQSRITVRDGVWRDKLKEEVASLQRQGFIVLKSKDLADAKAISAKVLSHSLAGLILSKSLFEVSIFWIEDGVYCKCRIDILSITEHGVVLGDLKNFGDISNENLLGNQIARMKYIHQMAWYSRAIESAFGKPPIRRFWIFVEDHEPHGVKVREADNAMIEAGTFAMMSLLPKYKECVEDDVWPSYPEDERVAAVPDWAFAVVGAE